MIRLITDFDGPIMDVSNRYYHVYQLCLEKVKRQDQEINQLSKAKFWELKRARIPEKKIGMMSGLDESQAKEFAHYRSQTVHRLEYLTYDQILPGVSEILEDLKSSGFDLVVMTMRKKKELEEAFNRYNLERFFSPQNCYCLSDDYQKTKDLEDKPILMQKALKELPSASDTWMIGDTEADIVAAKTNDIKVIGVLSGIRDRLQLENYEPNFIVNNLAEAIDIIKDQINS